MSNSAELIPIGIDLGSLHARVAIGNLAQHKAQPSTAADGGLADTRPLPDVISNAQGSRYTLALVGADNADGADGGAAEGGARHIFGEAARRALAREKKPTISKDPSSMVRELVRRSSSAATEDEPASRASAFFSHLADLACDASSSHPSKLRTVVSVPAGSTPEEQAGIVEAVERGINEAMAARQAGDDAKAKKKKGEAEVEEPCVMAIVTDPAAVCIAHGLTEAERPGTVDLASGGAGPGWKNVLVVDWGASGLTATHMRRTSPSSSLLSVVKSATDASCSGNAIISEVAKFCASMFERKNRVSGVLESKKAAHRLEMACESAVRTLSRAPTTTVAIDGLYEGIDMSVPISRPRFDMLMSGMLRKAEALLQAFAGDGAAEFDAVLLAGNVCDMPSASALVRTKLFPNASPGRGDVPPDEAVAIGCARHAASILSCDTHSREGGKRVGGACPDGLGPAARKARACPVTIGVCRIEKGKENGDVEAIISSGAVAMIEAGEPLPANVTRMITYTNGDDSWLANSYIGIVQMQGGSAKKSKLVGKIEEIPTEGDGKGFELTMELSAAGKLTLSVNGGPSTTL